MLLTTRRNGYSILTCLSDGSLKADDFTLLPWGLSGHRVITLVEHLLGVWHVCLFDNFFESEALAAELLRRCLMYSVGTLRKNRLPQDMLLKTKKPKPTKARPKGTIAAAVNVNHDIALYSLMDSGLVYLLDTAYGPGEMAQMARRSAERVTIS